MKPGALASATVVAALKSIGSPVSAPDLLARFEDRVLRANARLKEIAGEQRRRVSIGSTVAVAARLRRPTMRRRGRATAASTAIRDGAIAQLSRDHTEAQELVEKGVLTREDARTWPRRNVITRAHRRRRRLRSSTSNTACSKPGDTFVICSDGLTGHVADDEILGAVAAAEPQQALRRSDRPDSRARCHRQRYGRGRALPARAGSAGSSMARTAQSPRLMR